MKTKLVLKFFVSILFIMLTLFITLMLLKQHRNNESMKQQVELTLKYVYSQIDEKYPGRGLSDYESDEVVDIPKSYAMFMIAELTRYEKNLYPELPYRYKIAGQWLLEHSNLSPDGNVGWGVPIAWDAFGDNCINPKDTIYTITNAIVMHALLDWVEKSPSDAPVKKINQTIDSMIKPYLDHSMRTPAGLTPYSLTPNDRKYDAFNPAAYLAGQIQRYSTMVEPGYGQRLQKVADQTMQALLDHHLTDQKGKWYWYYSAQEYTPNDLPHASYIVLGIRDYINYGGNLGGQFRWPKIRDHLASFYRKGDILYGWPDFSSNIDLPARLYDVGIALHVVCNDNSMRKTREQLLQSIPSYLNDDGRYQKYPVASNLEARMGDRVVNEYVSYLYLGLLSCSQNSHS